MYKVAIFNHLGKPIHINHYNHVANLSAYNLYKPNSASINVDSGQSAVVDMAYTDRLYIADDKIYNVYKVVPAYMSEFYDGINFHLWQNKQSITSRHRHNIVTTKLLPDTRLWYIFSDRSYNIIIFLIAVFVVIAIIVMFNHIRSIIDNLN